MLYDPKKIGMIIVVAAMIIIASVPTVQASPRRVGVDLHVTGPREVFVNQTENYRVQVAGTFSDRANNWSLEVVTLPVGIIVDETSQSSNTSNVFNIEVIATRSGTFDIVIRGYCSDAEEVRYGETTLRIRAITPVTVEVDIFNPTDYMMNEIKVGVFVDGRLKGSEILRELKAGESKRVSIDWSKEDLDAGEYTMEIWVDYGYDGDTFERDEMIVTRTIYIDSNGASRLLIPILLIVLAASIGLFYFMRQKRKRRRPW